MIQFTRVRNQFEELLLKYKYFVNQIVQHRGSEERGLAPLLDLYNIVFNGVVAGKSEEEIVADAKSDQHLRYLSVLTEEDIRHRRNFSAEVNWLTRTVMRPKRHFSRRLTR